MSYVDGELIAKSAPRSQFRIIDDEIVELKKLTKMNTSFALYLPAAWVRAFVDDDLLVRFEYDPKTATYTISPVNPVGQKKEEEKETPA